MRIFAGRTPILVMKIWLIFVQNPVRWPENGPPSGRNFGGFAVVHSGFSVEGPKRAFLALFFGPQGAWGQFFSPNIGK